MVTRPDGFHTTLRNQHKRSTDNNLLLSRSKKEETSKVETRNQSGAYVFKTLDSPGRIKQPLRKRIPNAEDIFIVKPNKEKTSGVSSRSEDPSPLTPVKLSARQHSLVVNSVAQTEAFQSPQRPGTAQAKPTNEEPSSKARIIEHKVPAVAQESAVWGLSNIAEGMSFPRYYSMDEGTKSENILESKNRQSKTIMVPEAKEIRIEVPGQTDQPQERLFVWPAFDSRPIISSLTKCTYTRPQKPSKTPTKEFNTSEVSEDSIALSTYLCPLPIPPAASTLITQFQFRFTLPTSAKMKYSQPELKLQPTSVSPSLESNLCQSVDAPKKTRLHYLRCALKQMREQGYSYQPEHREPIQLIKVRPVPSTNQQIQQISAQRNAPQSRGVSPFIMVTPAQTRQQIESESSSRGSVRESFGTETVIDRTKGGVQISDKKLFLKRVISLKESPEMLAPPTTNLHNSVSGETHTVFTSFGSKVINSAVGNPSQMEHSRFQAPTQKSEQAPDSANRSAHSVNAARSVQSPVSLFSVGGAASKSSKNSLFNLIRENKLVSFLGKPNKDFEFLRPASEAYRQALRNEKHKILRKNVVLAKPKLVMKHFGDLRGLVVNTSSGASMNYNEDRVTILVKAHEKFEGLVHRGVQTCNYVAVYDGHGGSECCDYLKENLHVHLMKNLDAKDPITSIKEAVKAADEEFIQRAIKENKSETSGSCAVGLINFGIKEGKKGSDLLIAKSREEFLQIAKLVTESSELHTEYSPWRVKPGGLKITRSFGDADSKVKERGGLPEVIISEPEVVEKVVSSDMDFVLLGSDGVFDFVDVNAATQTIWDAVKSSHSNTTQDSLAQGLNQVLSQALVNGSDDNLTLMLVLLPGFEQFLQDSASRFSSNS